MLDVRPTPNPDAVKIVLPKRLFERPLVVARPQDAGTLPLAQELIAIEGVRDLFFLHDFVTVARRPGVAWEPLLAQVERVLRAHLG